MKMTLFSFVIMVTLLCLYFFLAAKQTIAKGFHAVLFRRYQTVLRHAGIPHGELHDLRRTFATKLYRFTGDQVLVDNYLGHASRTVTEKYYLGNQLAANRDLIRQFVI